MRVWFSRRPLPVISLFAVTASFCSAHAAPTRFGVPLAYSKPTINCEGTTSHLGRILCTSAEAAKADWDVNAAAWANAASLDGAARESFWREHNAWIQSVTTKCKLNAAITNAQRQCVLNVYRARTTLLRGRLSRDALAEAKLTPEQRAEIQSHLVELGLLKGSPDGEFGQLTRAAIKRFQERNGFPQVPYLAAQQRQKLAAMAASERKPTSSMQEARRLAQDIERERLATIAADVERQAVEVRTRAARERERAEEAKRKAAEKATEAIRRTEEEERRAADALQAKRELENQQVRKRDAMGRAFAARGAAGRILTECRDYLTANVDRLEELDREAGLKDGEKAGLEMTRRLEQSFISYLADAARAYRMSVSELDRPENLCLLYLYLFGPEGVWIRGVISER